MAFIEQTYGLGNIYSTYEYADFFAPDAKSPLGDFFGYPNTCQARSFTPINLQYSSSCQAGSDKHNPHACGATNCNQQGACLCSASCFISYPGGAKDADTN